MDISHIDAHYISGKSTDHLKGVISISQDLKEAALLSSIKDNFILGVIGVVEFDKQGLKEKLENAKMHPKIKVFRQAYPRIDDVWENGAKMAVKMGYGCEVELLKPSLPYFEKAVEDTPKGKFIITLPDDEFEAGDLKNLSTMDNVAVKVLGDRDGEDVLRLIDLFKTERVMFGSGSKKIFSKFNSLVSDFSEDEKKNLFCNSAKSWYTAKA